jgi:hypothetical protein
MEWLMAVRRLFVVFIMIITRHVVINDKNEYMAR